MLILLNKKERERIFLICVPILVPVSFFEKGIRSRSRSSKNSIIPERSFLEFVPFNACVFVYAHDDILSCPLFFFSFLVLAFKRDEQE